MRVAINATMYNHAPSGAIQRFRGLYDAVFALNEHDYTVFEPSDAALESYFREHRPARFVRTPLRSLSTAERVLVGSVYWRRALAARDIDLFDTSTLPLMRLRTGPTIFTVHDLRFIQFGHAFPAHRRALGRIGMRAALRYADAVVAVSDTMRNEILGFEPRASVVVLPNAIDWRLESSSLDHETVLAAPSRFILSVGHLERRKNLPRLLEAFARVCARGYEGDLVIVGSPANDSEHLTAARRESPVGRRIHFLSGLSRQHLDALYRAADLFVFPSLYEGFGIPILEAMKFGCPFVLSAIPVFHEIAGQQARYFDPSDVADMASVIEGALGSSDYRATCDGIAVSCQNIYAWPVVARRYADLLRSLGPK